MRPRLLWVGLLLCAVAGCGSGRSSAHVSGHSQATALRKLSLRSGGRRRSYLLYVPPGDSRSHPLPLVLVFHGAGATSSIAAARVHLVAIAQSRHNMIVAFLQGYDDTWNERAGDTPARQAHVDDVAFTQAVLDRIESRHHVDPRRVAATGLSNGALLTELLGCRLAARLTLIAPVEGQLPVSVSPGCHPAAPISVYEVHGTADQAIPYGGGHFGGVGGGTTVLSAPASARRWAALDGCRPGAGKSQHANVELATYDGCREHVTVTLATIRGGRHQWPADFAQTLTSEVTSLDGRRRAVLR